MGKKLIEVALPLDAINKESSREKSIRFGHPSTLHLWWARRPLATARAVIWASLIDDPSAHPDCFPTEDDQIAERKRLFKIIEKLVVWENATNQDVLNSAKAEIEKNMGGDIPELLDPFAGGGTIPLEAQRLGLKAHAHDLNPVAVMINKATIEIPARFSNSYSVNPDSRTQSIQMCDKGTAGLIEDIKYYAKWIKDKAYFDLKEHYPTIALQSATTNKGTVIAWLWTRIVKCPNPACGSEAPLIRNFKISKKKGNEAWVEPIYEDKKVQFKLHHSGVEKISTTISRKGGICACCGAPISFNYIREEAQAGRMYSKMFAVIAEGQKKREFLEPTVEHLLAANMEPPEEYPDAPLPYNPRNFQTPNYGMDTFASLFSNRQLNMLTKLCELVSRVESVIEKDAIDAGFKDDHIGLANGGDGAKAYAEAVCVYLAFAVDRETNYSSTLNGWSGDFIIQTFGRQAVPMVWDYAESNPFSNSTGNWDGAIDWIIKALANFPTGEEGSAKQVDAQSDCGLRNIMISTDPPYYDNIVYADLADYFYIWMRYMLKHIYPDVFSTMQVPKREELVATAYRFEGNTERAKEFFEDGMSEACRLMKLYTREDIPITIYYAYKQSETEVENDKERTASSGWETMLGAIINSGLMITGTWPIHTERETGLKAHMNALASSIVLVCRKRPDSATQITRRNLISALRKELKSSLKKMQDSNIAPVDLAQSAIGPGMGIFSQYKKVLEADGTPMSVRSALKLINEEIDLYFNEQVGSMDTASRFCVDLYTQCAYNDIKYGEAEVLANAKGTSIPMMASHGMLYAKAGVVHLVERDNLPEKVDSNEGNIWMLTQQLTRAMATGGVEACAHIVFNMFGSNAENAKDLAYRLYTIAERKGWANEAYAYNALVVAWPDIQTKAAELKAIQPEQMSLFDLGYIDKK